MNFNVCSWCPFGLKTKSLQLGSGHHSLCHLIIKVNNNKTHVGLDFLVIGHVLINSFQLCNGRILCRLKLKAQKEALTGLEIVLEARLYRDGAL